MFNTTKVRPLERKAVRWLVAWFDDHGTDRATYAEFEKSLGLTHLKGMQLIERFSRQKFIRIRSTENAFDVEPEIVDLWNNIRAEDRESWKWWADKLIFGIIFPITVSFITAYLVATYIPQPQHVKP